MIRVEVTKIKLDTEYVSSIRTRISTHKKTVLTAFAICIARYCLKKLPTHVSPHYILRFLQSLLKKIVLGPAAPESQKLSIIHDKVFRLSQNNQKVENIKVTEFRVRSPFLTLSSQNPKDK